MGVGGAPIPKRELIGLIVEHMDEGRIRELLNIQAATDLRRRLDDFSKPQLVDVLQSSESGNDALEKAKARYPFSSNPTLYLISVSSWPGYSQLVSVTRKLAKQGREAAREFGSDGPVGSVYMVAAVRKHRGRPPFQEIPLVYEKKIEYVVADPESQDYGENALVYSLEKALVWYCARYKHAVLLCADFPAVKPILTYGREVLKISWWLPNLSEEMLGRLASGANVRTASFTRKGNEPSAGFDARSVTISDPSLAQTASYGSLAGDRSRQQTSGFYASHPDLVYGGMGIARRYGRIWTPARLGGDDLLALSTSLIGRTEGELKREEKENPGGFIRYYRNVPIHLGRKIVTGRKRDLIEELIAAVIEAERSEKLEYELRDELVSELLKDCESIDVIPAVEVDCEQCGSYLARCPVCNSPLTLDRNAETLTLHCPTHADQQVQDDQSYSCECGATVNLTFSTDIRIYPGGRLLKAIDGFLEAAKAQRYDGSFVIIGNVLTLVPRQPKASGESEYHLADLQEWRVRARIDHRSISEEKKGKYQRMLGKIKEKCARNYGHSSYDICHACMQEQVTEARIKEGSDLCLARLFGYAIDEQFDGVHHGHEVADIRYADVLQSTGAGIHLGIHLKSREKPRPRGLGRSVSCIKGLYTQYCHSAYLAARGSEELDVIGVSVPNAIGDEVREDFRFISAQLGHPLMVLDETDWLLILDAALEKAGFEDMEN